MLNKVNGVSGTALQRRGRPGKDLKSLSWVPTSSQLCFTGLTGFGTKYFCVVH